MRNKKKKVMTTEAEEERAEMNEKGTIPLNVNDDARDITKSNDDIR